MSKAKPAVILNKSRNLADFRAIHDRNVIVPTKIKAGLADLAKGGPDNWEYEGDFVKRAGISNGEISAFRDQFADHVVQARGRASASRKVWVATARGATKFRAVLGG